MTSALCKSLYEDNIALKSKHEAFLSRLPVTDQYELGRSSPSPLPSPTPSPRPSPANSPSHTPHYYTVSLPQTPHDSVRPLTPSPPPRPRHGRRASVTLEELATLADQNSELLNKLEKLEEESEAADHAGKRKLRKLEKEIQGLREELEKTRQKGAEIEEKTNAVLAVHEPEIQRRRREEREERIRGLREKSIAISAPHSLDSDLPRDFAPPPELPRSNLLKPIPESTISPPPTVNLSTKPHVNTTSISNPVDVSQGSHNASGQLTLPQMEYAIISQLLSKIRELEVTNSQITEEQRTTADRYRSMQRDADSLRRAYDNLGGDSEDLRPLSHDPSGTKGTRSVSADTITFSSPRRTLDRDINHLSDDSGEFARGIGDNMQSTTRSVIGGPSNQPSANHKARKSVVGLFDAEVPTDRGSFIEADYPPSVTVSPAFRHASPSLSTDLGDLSLWSTAATEGLNISSPAMSSLGLSAKHVAGQDSVRRHTLESELGSNFGDDWSEGVGNHHLRTSSLYELVGSSRETSPTPGGSPTGDRPQLFYTPESPRSDVDWEDADAVSMVSVVSVAGSAVPQSSRGLELDIEPSTPRASRLMGPQSSALELGDPRWTRNYRLSQTVRARTNRWVEGRYGEVNPNAIVRRRLPTGKHKQRASDASMVFSETFETVVRQMSFSSGLPMETDDEDGDGESTVKAMELRPVPEENRVVVTPNTRQQGFVGFVLEIWLWLQFVIVVLVFLWAMARRGPKNVLKDAERRKSVVPVRS